MFTPALFRQNLCSVMLYLNDVGVWVLFYFFVFGYFFS